MFLKTPPYGLNMKKIKDRLIIIGPFTDIICIKNNSRLCIKMHERGQMENG